MKKDKVKQEWDEHRTNIVKECAIWENLRVRGGQDPFYPDGVNMNLTKNHVIYAKRCLREMAAEHGWELPDEYYLQTPPEVDDGYMANLKQKDRVKRLKSTNKHLTTAKPEAYDDKQMSLI